MAKVEIYTRPHCSYSERAIALLKHKGAEFTEISVNNNPELRAEMVERSGRNTFPQIFIDGLHIGGCDDLVALDQRGGLDPLLAE